MVSGIMIFPSRTPSNAVTYFSSTTVLVSNSLVPSQDHLLTLTSPLLELLLGVLPLVLFTPLYGLQFLVLDLSRLLDHLRYVPVTLDALDLGPST